MTLTVISGGGKRPQDVTEEMADRIKAVIYDYSDRTTLAAALGVLHIVAREILEEAQ